jgi:outer membrane lipoprotein carrier protein
MTRPSLVRIGLLSLLAISSVGAQESRTALEAFSHDLRGLDGRFVQRVYDADGRLDEETHGRVALSAPRQFRWEYESPFPQLIVADGDHVWIYDPDLEQAQVRKQSLEEQQSPLTVLIDPTELERQFVVRAAPDRDGLAWVVLTPRDADTAQVESAELGFLGAELASMVMSDALGQRTEIRFSGWKRNPRFERGTFDFVPPDGVDVIGERIESAEVHAIPD